MDPRVKRVVILGIAAAVAAAVYLNVSGRDRLPAANPAAAAAVPTAPLAQPTVSAEQAAQVDRVQELQQRLAANPRDQMALAEMVDGLFQAKRYAQAADLLNEALEAGQDNSRLRVGLGLALFYQGMPSLAKRELRRAIDLDPNNAQAHFNYALTISHGPRADLDGARAAWETVIRLDPEGELGRRSREFLSQTGPGK